METIVFDFGNVLCSFDKDIFLKNLSRHCPASKNEIKGLLFDSGLEDRYSKGEITTEDFYSRMKDELDLQISKDKFLEFYCGIFEPNKEVMSLVKDLQGRYRLQLFSDTCKIHYRNVIRNISVYNLFDAETLSFRVGSLKHSKDGYKDVIRKSECPGNKIVYIDDIEEYVDIGEEMGMNTVLFKGIGQLKEELRNLGIKF